MCSSGGRRSASPTELKNIDAGVYFGADPASPDTLNKFFFDVQMFANNPDTTDPQTYLSGWLCGADGENIAKASNGFNAQNYERWCSPEYDALFAHLCRHEGSGGTC